MNEWVELDLNKECFQKKQIEEFFEKKYVGQQEPVKKVVSAIHRIKAGMSFNPEGSGPLGVFLFLGPSGTGKSLLSKVAADYLLGSPMACVQINCSEYKSEGDANKMFGSPPGYTGHYSGKNDKYDGKPPVLSWQYIYKRTMKYANNEEIREIRKEYGEEINRIEEYLAFLNEKWGNLVKSRGENDAETKKALIEIIECNNQLNKLMGKMKAEIERSVPCFIVVLDEIEKAHHSVFDNLLQILEEGTLQMGNGDITNFNRVLLFLTGNIGARRIDKGIIGFDMESDGENRIAEIKDIVNEEMRKIFSLELINRFEGFNALSVFQEFSDDEIGTVLRMELKKQGEMLRQNCPGLFFQVSEDVIKHLLGFANRRYGARLIRASVRSKITEPLIDLLCFKQLREGEMVRISLREGKLVFEKNITPLLPHWANQKKLTN